MIQARFVCDERT